MEKPDIFTFLRSSEKAERKKGPGRPSRKQVHPLYSYNGVEKKPYEKESFIEFVTDSPIKMQRIFTYLKNRRCAEFFIRFTPVNIIIYAWDHQKTSRILSVIDCKNANWYYCKSEIILRHALDKIDSIFSCVDDDYYCLYINLRNPSDNELEITFKHQLGSLKTTKNELAITQTKTVDVDLLETAKYLLPENIEKMPIEFIEEAKSFKKEITNKNKFANKLRYEQIGGSKLTVVAESEGLVVKTTTEKPELFKSKVSKGEFFSCEINTSDIKSALASVSSDGAVHVWCNQKGTMILQATDGKLIVTSTIIGKNI